MKRIAVVDDDDNARLVLKGLIEAAGYTVVAVGSTGVDAVDICASARIDLIFMDIKMPLKNGIDAAREITSKCPVPIVMLTGSDDTETLMMAGSAGAFAYLIKPVRLEEIAPAIELALMRFDEMKALRDENLSLKNAAKERKLVEKAKGLLMEKEGLGEDEAFARLRRISMDRRMPMAEVAGVIILALEKK